MKNYKNNNIIIIIIIKIQELMLKSVLIDYSCFTLKIRISKNDKFEILKCLAFKRDGVLMS